MSSLLDRSQASISGTFSQLEPSPSQSDSPMEAERDNAAPAGVFRIAVWLGRMGFVVQITLASPDAAAAVSGINAQATAAAAIVAHAHK